MGVPVLIYLAFNLDTSLTRDGWTIPAATDIAFALLGTRTYVFANCLPDDNRWDGEDVIAEAEAINERARGGI